MPLMKSRDGRLYNMPDEDAAKYLIPPDKLAETFKQAGIPMPFPGVAQNPGQVQAYHWGNAFGATALAATMLTAMPDPAAAAHPGHSGGSFAGNRPCVGSPGGGSHGQYTGHGTSHGQYTGRVHSQPGVVCGAPGPTYFAPPSTYYAPPAPTYYAPPPPSSPPPPSPSRGERYTSTFDYGDAQRIANQVGGSVSGPRFWRNSSEGPIYIYDVIR